MLEFRLADDNVVFINPEYVVLLEPASDAAYTVVVLGLPRSKLDSSLTTVVLKGAPAVIAAALSYEPGLRALEALAAPLKSGA
jgi:hypothetical protein